MQAACAEAFEYFDADSDSFEEIHEILEFLQETYPAIVRSVLLRASVDMTREFIADKNHISLSVFIECYEYCMYDIERLTMGVLNAETVNAFPPTRARTLRRRLSDSSSQLAGKLKTSMPRKRVAGQALHKLARPRRLPKASSRPSPGVARV